MEFWPDTQIADSMVADGLWFVAPCNKSPRTSHNASSCRIEVATLTEEGMRQGRKTVADFLTQFDNEKAKKTLELLPFRVRSLFLCLLTKNYEVGLDFSQELNSILLDITNRVNLYQIPLPKVPFNIIFDPVLRLFQYSTDKLSLFGLGAKASRHNTGGWQAHAQVYDVCPEFVKLLLSLGVPYDELFLSHASQEILNSAPEQFAKLELLVRLTIASLRKESILPESRMIGLEDPEVETVVRQFVKELQKKGIVSKRDQWDRIQLLHEIGIELTEPLANDLIGAVEKWWKGTLSETKVAIGRAQQIIVTEERPKQEQSNKPAVPSKEMAKIVQRVPLTVQSEMSILLGTNLATSNPEYWSPLSLPNPHMVIVGTSGMGKTETSRSVIHELSKRRISSIILDPHNEYASSAEVVIDIREGVSINPLELLERSPLDTTYEISSILRQIYGLGDQQESLLRKAIKKAYEDAKIDSKDPKSWNKTPPTFFEIKENLLQFREEDSQTRGIVDTLLNRLEPIFDIEIFSKETSVSFEQMTTKNTAIELKNLPTEQVKSAVSDFFLRRLWYYMTKLGQTNKLRFYAVIDEAHRLAHDEKSPIVQFLREARKYGVGVILASQTPRDFSEYIVANVGTFVCLKLPLESDANFMAKQLRCTSSEIQNLDARGKALVKYANSQKPELVQIDPMAKRQ